jgi:hypothetical protein
MIACIVKVLGIYKVELVDLEVFRRVWVSCVCEVCRVLFFEFCRSIDVVDPYDG